MQQELAKLNKSQLKALRSALYGRGKVHVISVNEKTNAVTVEFVYDNGFHVAHHLMLGKRGRIVYHEVQKVI